MAACGSSRGGVTAAATAAAALLFVTLVMGSLHGAAAGCANPETIRVVSDIHMGSWWFTNRTRHRLLESFLDEFLSATPPNVSQIVFNGDVFDFWLRKLNEMQPSDEKLITSTGEYGYNISRFRERVRKIADRGLTKVIVIQPGNHDLELDAGDVRIAFGDKVKFMPGTYIYKNVRFEHGHQYDLYNTPDPDGLRAFGYYVSRAATSSGISSGGSSLAGIIKWIFNTNGINWLGISAMSLRATYASILKQIFDAVWEGETDDGYDMHKRDVIVGGDPYYGGKNCTIEQMVSLYDTTIDRFLYKYNDDEDYVSGLFAGSMNDFSYFLPKFKEDIVVFGHTHEALMQTVSREDEEPPMPDLLYVNDGGWVDHIDPTYADIQICGGAPSSAVLKVYGGGMIRAADIIRDKSGKVSSIQYRLGAVGPVKGPSTPKVKPTSTPKVKPTSTRLVKPTSTRRQTPTRLP